MLVVAAVCVLILWDCTGQSYNYHQEPPSFPHICPQIQLFSDFTWSFKTPDSVSNDGGLVPLAPLSHLEFNLFPSSHSTLASPHLNTSLPPGSAFQNSYFEISHLNFISLHAKWSNFNFPCCHSISLQLVSSEYHSQHSWSSSNWDIPLISNLGSYLTSYIRYPRLQFLLRSIQCLIWYPVMYMDRTEVI